MKKKWIGTIVVSVAIMSGAETTNTWGGGSRNLGDPANWNGGVAPTFTDWSANLVFGADAGDYVLEPKNAGGTAFTASILSMRFTDQAAGTYIWSGGTLRMSGLDAIVNDSTKHVRFVAHTADLLWNATYGSALHVRANNSNIRFETYGNGVRIGTDNVHFHAGAGKEINVVEKSGSFLTAINADRLLTFHGDGTGGTLAMNGGVSEANGYALDLSVTDAGVALLSMSDGQFRNVTLQSGTLDYDGDDMISGNLTFDAGINTVSFNGNNDTLGTLGITGGDNVLDFGSAASDVIFDDSSSLIWTSGLVITNFNAEIASIRFGVDVNGLTEDQLAQITVNGMAGASLDPSGFLTIPEPATISLIVVSGFGIFMVRRTLH
ncbi:MAG: hypothetical protein AB7E95_09740 [Kiritimatiellales bacterium]